MDANYKNKHRLVSKRKTEINVDEGVVSINMDKNNTITQLCSC